MCFFIAILFKHLKLLSGWRFIFILHALKKENFLLRLLQLLNNVRVQCILILAL